MANKSNAVRVMAKLILTLFILLGFTHAQDTIYIQQSGAMVQIDLRQNQYNIIKEDVSASKFTNGSLPIEVLINNNATTVLRLTKIAYIFKISGSVVTDIDSIVSAINGLNPGGIPTFKLWKIIEIVTALPATPDPLTTYYVGAQTTIEFTSLDGDRDKVYKVEGWLIGASSNDAMALRVNGISINNYDYGYGYVGSTTFSTANNSNTMNMGSMQGNTSANQISLYVEAETGKNRQFMWEMNTIGVSQQVIFRPLVGGGIWRNTSSNMTSLQFTAPSVTGMYGVGTKFRLYRLQ
jgi:hypothetical protein